MNEILHFSHENHSLILREPVQELANGQFPTCHACDRQVSSGPAYGCEPCQYFLHKVCAERPTRYSHPTHPQHELHLVDELTVLGTGTCDACSKELHGGFTYYCPICTFDLHMQCALFDRSKKYKHIGHDHPLTYHPRQALFKCDACGVRKAEGSFQCVDCQLWIHRSCAYLPKTLTHLYHNHPLSLTFDIFCPYVNCNSCCTFCLGRISPSNWIYHCQSCNFLVHLNCMETGNQLVYDESSCQEIESTHASGSGNSGHHQPHLVKNSDGGLMEELEKELSKIIGLEDLKLQLRTWAKGLLLDSRRQKLGKNVGAREPPHIAFLGNPGTGKTTVTRILGKLLHKVGVLSSDKVVEVQRTDLVGQYLGHTGPKTKAKIAEAEGGILFVDEAYRLIGSTVDFGMEALEEIMSVMEGGKLVIIFAGYKEKMQHVLASNEGFRRRINTLFIFDDYSCLELAKILALKMTIESSRYSSFELDPFCKIDVVAELIEKMTTKEQRSKMNAGLVDQMLTKARENLDLRLPNDCGDEKLLMTITFEDLQGSLELLNKNQTIGFESNDNTP